MKFIEVNGTIINTAHIVKIEQHPFDPNEGLGDVNIHILLSNGQTILDPEVDYPAMFKRWDELKKELEVA